MISTACIRREKWFSLTCRWFLLLIFFSPNLIIVFMLVTWWSSEIVPMVELEPVCCKKQQKKIPDQLLVCGIGDFWRTWMIPNWFYMSPSDTPDHPGSIYTIQNCQRSPIPQTSNWSGIFFCCFLQQTGSIRVFSRTSIDNFYSFF